MRLDQHLIAEQQLMTPLPLALQLKYTSSLCQASVRHQEIHQVTLLPTTVANHSPHEIKTMMPGHRIVQLHITELGGIDHATIQT